MSKKLISWIPLYDTMGFASTRIRLLYPHQSINKYYSDQYESVIGYREDADILIIQKKLDAEALGYARNFKGFKIYDYDDPVYGHENFRNMVNLVDLVTTDVKGSKALFDSMGLGKPCIVAEDCLDYGISELLEPAEAGRGLVWFGNAACYPSIHSMLDYGYKLGYNLRLISDLNELQSLCPNAAHIRTERVAWSATTMVDELRRSSTCLLSHAGGAEHRKSNNKMIVAIAAGLPVIAGPSDSYLDLLTQFQLQDFQVFNEDEFAKAAGILENPKARADYLQQIQPYILNRYSTKNVTANFLEEIQQYA